MNIPFKSVLQDIKVIKEKNAKFKELSEEYKRKEIAYDCLLLFLAEIAKPAWIMYWSDELLSKRGDENTTSEQFCESLNNIESCEVCAKGGVMLSAVRLGNSIKPGMSMYQDVHRSISCFSRDDLNKMENQYEHAAYQRFVRDSTKDNMILIMCNVIANGNYSETDQTDYLKLWS